MTTRKRPPKWMKSKGYVHLTPSLNIQQNWQKYLQQIKNADFISCYAFYPLIHRNIHNRRYKKPIPHKHITKNRSHRHITKTGEVELSVKNRPLHYASHFDSLIYAYYGEKLKKRYEKILKKNPLLDESVLAYRSIPIKDSKKGKSNIHFAKETFDEIQRHFERHNATAVLTLDLKSFFSSLCHKYLYTSWCKLLKTNRLPSDHYNVFRACTNFNYILLDDLRLRRNGNFDEENLAKIRKKYGYKSFFATNADFRESIKQGILPIYANPFMQEKEHGKKEKTGIPQGLPISAVLSNIYLLEFDSIVINSWVKTKEIIYRRYSDDILIICLPNRVDRIFQNILELLKRFRVELSPDKTERFIFQNQLYNHSGDRRLTSIRINEDSCTIDTPLTYLGFEYRGYSTHIKSANLAKYYRRMIQLIKRKAKRAKKISELNPTIPRAVYINQIKKLYNAPLKYVDKKENKQVFRRRYQLVVDDRGDFHFQHTDDSKRSSNYISYIRRCDEIFETNAFSRQLRRKREIIGQAINRHLL